MELSPNDLRDLLCEIVPATNQDEQPYMIGQGYFIRTVTHYLTGRVQRVTQQEIIVTEAAWIADTGRFANAIKTCDFDEVEPFPEGEVIIGRGSVIDAIKIDTLPKAQK